MATRMHGTPRVAIVTTLIDAGPVLDSFIRYHLAMGFDRLFLFFDDRHDASIERARRYRRVEAIVHDDSLRERWRATRIFSSHELEELVDREVMVRQILNAEVAIQIALEQNMDWILHVDIDELFYSPKQSASSHFGLLDGAGIDYLTYLNFEAVPESSEIGDYFREVTLFKKNPHAIDRLGAAQGDAWLDESQKKVLQTVPELADQYFLYYRNGKSAARLRDDLVPNSVHDFRLIDRKMEPNFSPNPIVLHYACCGFDQFWHKYRLFGRHPDTWFGIDDITKAIGPFHLASRDVVMSGDKAAARDFYRRKVMIPNTDHVMALINCGLLLRIPGPSQLLKRLSGG